MKKNTLRILILIGFVAFGLIVAFVTKKYLQYICSSFILGVIVANAFVKNDK